MNWREVIIHAISSLSPKKFLQVRDALLEQGIIRTSALQPEDITPVVLAEKICDKFWFIRAKSNKHFWDLIRAYMDDLIAIVEPRIAEPVAASKEAPAYMPRARKYYNKAKKIREKKQYEFDDLIDYTWLMLCLYVSILKNEQQQISNVDLRASELDMEALVAALKAEKDNRILGLLASKPRFDISDLCGKDSCTFLFVILFAALIINDNEEEEEA